MEHFLLETVNALKSLTIWFTSTQCHQPKTGSTCILVSALAMFFNLYGGGI
jgi:hypothetical protein